MVKRAQYTLGNTTEPFPVATSGSFLIRTSDNSAWEYVAGTVDGYTIHWNGVKWVARQPEGIILTPSSLSGDVNNYNPSGISSANYLRLNGGAADRTITGIIPPTYDKRLIIINIGTTNNIILSHENLASNSGSRFAINGEIDLTISVNGSATIWYDTVSQRWRVGSSSNEGLSLTDSTPEVVSAGTDNVGVATTAARADHKHDIATASAVSVGAVNSEGVSSSLARADHTHIVNNLSISSQTHGDILYFNGTSWVRLAAGTDGYFLTTHSSGQNPSWSDGIDISRTTDLPADVTKAAALVGISEYAARSDHKHNIITAAASTLSGSNSEGSATSLARSDHNHALGGSVGGDLSGTLPNPTVTDLTITNEAQGDVLYFNGSNWVRLAAGSDGYFLTTHGPGQNPNYTGINPLSRGTDLPANVTKSPALVGVSAYGARADHKHDINTATANSVGTTNTEGSSTSLARADHTHAVIDFNINSQAQGDILYFNGSNWVRLAASTDGYFLTTHSSGQNPTWSASAGLSRTTDFPTDITKSAALVGTSAYAARSDHKHNIQTAAASTLSGSNSEGTSTALSRADHNHALGGSVGGDLSGTLPNPTVTDLTIASEEQGSILYYNGSNWVQLSPDTDGYFLTTHSINQNPTWSLGTPLSRTTDFPVDVTKSPALVGTSVYVARSDHKHNINTATAVSIGSTNAEGTSTALARADHTHAVTNLSISSQVQGDILYFNGSNWVRLAAGTDGYQLTTHSAGQNPTWETTAQLSISTDFPADVTKNPALVGSSFRIARSDHKHNISTAAASTLSGSNLEGTSTALARADHNHALGGTVGGDLAGTLPNPTVTDLTITNEAQGDILYFNGSNWVRLAPGTDGYYLTTHGAGQNPNYTGINPIARTTDLPVDVTKSPALVGASVYVARSDHKHNISTAAASALSGSNSEGTATSLARSDHNHALGGSVGGDLSGTLPNPTVTDLTIASEAQGDVLYFNGSNWVRLAAGTDGYFLTTHGASQNPTWSSGTASNKKISELDAVSAIDTDDLFVVVEDGTTRKATTSEVAEAISGNLSFSGEAQGNILYYNGSSWVVLAPGTDGYGLITHGAGQNPTWGPGISPEYITFPSNAASTGFIRLAHSANSPSAIVGRSADGTSDIVILSWGAGVNDRITLGSMSCAKITLDTVDATGLITARIGGTEKLEISDTTTDIKSTGITGASYIAQDSANVAGSGFIRLAHNQTVMVGRNAANDTDLGLMNWGGVANDELRIGAASTGFKISYTVNLSQIHEFRCGTGATPARFTIASGLITTPNPVSNTDDTVGNVKAYISTSQNSVEDTDFDPTNSLSLTVAITAGTWGAVEMRAVVFDTTGTNSTICLFEKTGQASYHRASGNTIQIGSTVYSDGYEADTGDYTFTIAASSTNMVGTLTAESGAPSNAAAMIIVTRFESDKPG